MEIRPAQEPPSPRRERVAVQASLVLLSCASAALAGTALSRGSAAAGLASLALSAGCAGAAVGRFRGLAARFGDASGRLELEGKERLRLSKSLCEAEERYRILLEESRDAVFFTKAGGELLEANPAGVRMLGYPSQELLAASPGAREFYVFPEDRDVLVARLAAEGKVFDFPVKLRRKDGAEIDASNTATAIRDPEGKLESIRSIVRDVTERHQLEQQLRQSQKMEAVGQLAGGIAHDFNNILTAILGFSHLLESRLPPGDPLSDYPKNIAAAAERATELTRGLLAFSRKQVLNMRSVPLNELIRKLVPMLRRLVREDIDLETSLCGSDSSVVADPVQVEQVVMNLVTNAVDAMPDGGRISIETKSGEGHVVLSVSDTGTGMDEATQDRIFDPFFTTKEVGKGTGLGLAMVYGIVRQHQGTIYVHSDLGKGTTFRISLPAGGAVPEVADPLPPLPEGAVAGNETILVAEDDEALRGLVKEMLEGFGYTVLLASDGAEALDVYRGNASRIDMLLIDLVMPRMNGRAFFAEARALNPDVRALFYSGYAADRNDGESVIEPGMHLLPKPFSVRELGRKVRQILDAPA